MPTLRCCILACRSALTPPHDLAVSASAKNSLLRPGAPQTNQTQSGSSDQQHRWAEGRTEADPADVRLCRWAAGSPIGPQASCGELQP